MAAGAVESWYHEKESAWLYGAVAAAEPDPVRRALFIKLAAAEDQAARWLAGRPERKPVFTPAFRARIVARLVRILGPHRLLRVLAAMKLRGLSVYSGPPAPAAHAIPTTVAEVGKRHSTAGGKLRAAVFGASDGLVSNASLVMAAGEYVSVRSQREFYEHQMALERRELAEYPEAEAEELALDVLAREELGLNPDDLGSPFAAAGSSFVAFVAFAAGATVPLVPFFAGASGNTAIYASASVTALMLIAVGVTLSLFTGKGALRGGLRMLLIGGGAGIAAWAVGKMLGASLLG